MILTYDAIDAQGRRSADSVEAHDVREAVDQLRRRGLYVTQIAEAGGAKTPSAASSSDATAVRLPLKTLALFTRQMAMLLRAGSGVVPALTAIKRQMKRPQHAALHEQIAANLEDGVTLTDSLRRHPRTFDSVYCAITAAGEASAALTQMFERLTTIVGKRRAMRNKILGAMAYPALLIFMCIHIIGVLLMFVLPRFAQMFIQLGVQTPASTQALLSVGQALHDYWPIVLVVNLALVFLAVWSLGSSRGRQWLSNLQLSIPILGRLRGRLIQAQMLRTMGMLLESRVGVLDTLELVRQSTGNARFQRLFDDLEQTVTSGGQLSAAFERSGIVEPYICQAVRTGEDSGNLGGAMTYCADVLDETNTELINVVTKLLEPAILIIMGLVVGAVAISLFLPLFDLTSAIH